MRVACVRCQRGLDYAAERPSFCPFCGQALGASDPDRTTPADPDATGPAEPAVAADLPERVGRYRLLRRIGAGGMGTVYEAEEGPGGRRVALKLISPAYGGSAGAVARFRREGRLAGLIAHPRCVFVLAADEDAGRPYLVMELMPGATLKDLVERRGPLPPAEAVAHALDVIEGLQEVHRHGIVHRDIKPSNCFLDGDGRAKVGDFGLARSLAAEADLTRTGTVMGTPLFAAPEQLKGEAVDERGDVYAVAATLYYLLTGRAPHEGRDAAAVAARIASEPPPSPRALRPGLPNGLDRVVLRGLERRRDRRYRDLEAFRRALLPFAPAGALSMSGMGRRLIAGLIDGLAVGLAIILLRLLAAAGPWPQSVREFLRRHDFELITLPFLAAVVVYFGLLEGVWRCSLGKRLLGLRVYRSSRDRRAGAPRIVLRAFVFGLLPLLPFYLVPQLPLDCGTLLLLWVLSWTQLPGVFLIICTMRARNGYRGVHEFLSGTRTVQLPWPGQRPRPSPLLSPRSVARLTGWLTRPAALPAGLGPFRVRGAVGSSSGAFWLGEDAALERDVLLWVRPADAAPLSEARREVNRPTRLRWLTGGADAERRWDAFVAPAGRPVTEIVAAAGPLPWAEVRPLLAQLTDELVAACADRTLPERLTVNQVLVRHDGDIEFLDAPPRECGGAPAADSSAPPERRAVAMLLDFAVLTLEGKPRAADDVAAYVRRPLPPHASAALAALFGPKASLSEFRRRLEAVLTRPARVTRAVRAFHLLVQGVLLFVLFFVSIIVDRATADVRPGWVAAVGAWPIVGLSLLWAFLLRGGPSFPMAGVALVRSDGRRAARWQAAWRSALVWAQGLGPFLVLAAITGWWQSKRGGDLFWYLAALALWAVFTAWLPRRTLHDRLAGTYLVPE